jgi:hypothetical protein
MVPRTDRFDARSTQRVREALAYAVDFEKSGLVLYGQGHPACTFIVRDESHWRALIRSDAYQLALAFVRSEFDVEGDLVEAIKTYYSLFVKRSRPALKTIAAYLWYQIRCSLSCGSSVRDIQFHYDRSNEFYREFSASLRETR